MYALRESYPAINSMRRELTMLIFIVMLFIVVANFIVIFGNTHILHTKNKSIWLYDLFAILFWIINVGSWLVTYWDIVKDNSIIHLLFFITPLILLIWGSVIIFHVKEIIVTSLWQLFLCSYISSIIIFTVFLVFICIEIKKIKKEEIEEECNNGEENIIRGTYKLMTNSGEYFLHKHNNQHLSNPNEVPDKNIQMQKNEQQYSQLPTSENVSCYV